MFGDNKVEKKVDELALEVKEIKRMLENQQQVKVEVPRHSTKKLSTPKPERLNCYLEKGMTAELKTLMKLEGLNSMGDLFKFLVKNYEIISNNHYNTTL